MVSLHARGFDCPHKPIRSRNRAKPAQNAGLQNINAGIRRKA
jgi:hypothetical protein